MITLHIGTGTFTPVKAHDIEGHAMEAEWVEISEETARDIKTTEARGEELFLLERPQRVPLNPFPMGMER